MALYHRHRPQNFSSVVCQEHIIKTITQQIAQHIVSHAYLFSGPRGVGKTTIARLLAKAINCQTRKSDEFEPCNVCASCLDIGAARAIDVIEIDAASHTGVDNVRENIIENAHFKPTHSPYKVFIIDEVHMLSTSAFNALLKIMEEPPLHVIFVLATTERHKVPETVASRCQQFQFTRVSQKLLKSYIDVIAKKEKMTIANEVSDRIVQKSDGCAREAINLLEQLMSAGSKTISVDVASLILPIPAQEKLLGLLELIVSRDIGGSLKVVNALRDEDGDWLYIVDALISLVRLLMIEHIQGATLNLSVDMSNEGKKKLLQLGKLVTTQNVLQLLDLLLEKRRLISLSPLPQLPLEMAIIEWIVGSVNLEKTVQNEEELVQEKSKLSLGQRVKELVTREEKVVLEDTLRSAWQKTVAECGQQAPAITFVLNMAEIISIEKQTLTIAVPYTFHRDKLLEPKCRRSLENILSRHCDAKIHIEVAVKKSQSDVGVAPVLNELADLASALGGEVVT